MKTILSQIRHAVTGLAGIGTYLATLGLVEPASIDAANQAGEAMVDPLAGLLALVAVALVRMAMAKLGRIFPTIAEKASGGMSGGALLLVACGTAAALMGALPSCSAAQITAARAIPIRISVTGPDASASYSSKVGLDVTAVVRPEDGPDTAQRFTKDAGFNFGTK